MKCIILAAGTSSRLSSLAASKPKCLLEVGRYTILERTIRSVLLQDISQFVIVTGFRADTIRSYAQSTFPFLQVEFIDNERFAETNNGYSLALASRSFQDEDILLLDSDIVFDAGILARLLSSPHENSLVVRTKGRFDVEEIKVTVDQNGRVLKIGKQAKGKNFFCESVGIERFSGRGSSKLAKILHRRIFRDGRENEFYEASFQELIDSGTPIFAVDANDYPCIEIDTPEDLHTARGIIAPQLDRN